MVVAPAMALPLSSIELEREELAQLMLSRLRPKQREAIELRMAGYSYAAAAETLGISIRSVRIREERGMAHLRQLVVDNPDLFHLP